MLGLTILVIATSAYILGWTNIFTIQDISITGSPTKEISNQVLQISTLKKGQKLARVEPRKIENNLALAGIDWVESVDLSRNWITRKVNIDLKARTPIATSGSQYLDSAGVLFTSPIKVMKQLVSINAATITARSGAVEFLQKLPADFTGELASISAVGENQRTEFAIILKSGLAINWGQDRDNPLKLKIYKALLDLPENKKIREMDLGDPTKPTVR